MNDDPASADADALERLGLFDPSAPDAAERLELIRFAMARGATVQDIAAATNLGELALDRQLRPRSEVTWGEAVAAMGLDWPTAQRLMTAIGIGVDQGDAVTTGEAETVELLASASSAVLGEEAMLQLARVAGNAMARVAETLVGAFRLQVQLPRRDAGTRYIDIVKEYSDLADRWLPGFVRALDTLLRRQMVAVAERMWSTDEDRSVVTLPRTVGFVDLVGYTATASTLTVRELTAVLIDFDTRTSDVVARGNGQIIKTIGDEAMFVTEDAGDACRIALDLVGASAGALPPVRVGLAAGDVISVFGDVYGPDVNLAARLVAIADPMTAVVSGRVRAAAHGFRFQGLPPVALKGFPEPTIAYRLQG